MKLDVPPTPMVDTTKTRFGLASRMFTAVLYMMRFPEALPTQLTTRSVPVTTLATSCAFDASPWMISTSEDCFTLAGVRARRTREWPLSRARRTNWVPTPPVPPRTPMRTILLVSNRLRAVLDCERTTNQTHFGFASSFVFSGYCGSRYD